MGTNEKALDRFLEIVGEIRTTLEAIQAAAGSRKKKTQEALISWAFLYLLSRACLR
jgi:hypothetical protein